MRAHAKLDIHTFCWHGGRCWEQCSDETASLCTHRLVDSLQPLDGLYCHRCVNTSATGTTYFWLNSNGIEKGAHLCVACQRLNIALEDEQFVFEDGPKNDFCLPLKYNLLSDNHAKLQYERTYILVTLFAQAGLNSSCHVRRAVTDALTWSTNFCCQLCVKRMGS